MADNNDSFDEFLNRAEEDYDAGDIEAAEAGDEDDVLDDVEGGEDESRPGAFVSEENKARSLIDMSSIANPHGSIVEGANGGEGTIVRSAYLGKEMQTSFLEYAMSVIVSRALPDVRDGLKPVHRRILYAMNESGYTPNRPHMKSARTVGDVIGKYHPHGDSAVYDTMVRLAQPFSMRVPLVDGHGNFGSIDGDGAAAMRYTESRLDKVAMELLRDLDKETVDFQPNYDESLEEPTVLPARFPNLLVNGSQGIAVGMATNIPPHNLGETIDATCLMLDNPDVTTEELMKALPGPDFPTGGIIMGKKGIRDAYETGRGSLTVRAKCKVEEGKNGRSSIVVTEIPYQVNRQRLLEKLGELVREKKLPEISNIHDGADRHGIDIIIDLKKDAIPQVVLNKLYKHTQLQVGFGVIMLSLVDGAPRRPDRHQPEGQRPPHLGEARGSGREGAHGVERRQGHHVGRGRSTCHGPRHHGRARHERAAHRQGAGHGDRAARYRPVRHHREGLRQAHPHRRVPRAPSRRPGRVHHHDDREEGPAGRHEDRRRRRRDHDHVRGRCVRAHSGIGHLRARPLHAGRVRDEDGRQGPRDRGGHLQPRQEEESLRRAGGRRGTGRERHRRA